MYGPRSLAFLGYKVLHGQFIVPRKPLPVPRARVTLEILSKTSGRRRIRLLRKNGLIASPLVPEDIRKYASKSDFIRFLNIVEDSLPTSKLSELFLASFEAFNAFYISVKTYNKGYKLTKEFEKNISLMKCHFLNNPTTVPEELKLIWNSFRAEVIERRERIQNPFSYFYPLGVSDSAKLQASMVIRGLPKYNLDLEPFLKKTQDVWTANVPKPNLEEWNSWIKEWVDFYRPVNLPDFYPFSLGTSACLEKSRRKGGVREATKEIMSTTLNPKRQSQFDKYLSNIKRESLGKVALDPYRSSYFLLMACLTILEPCISHARKCNGGCKFISSHPPMCILAIRERGFKVRLPTMTIAPIVILSKALRQVAELYLRSDPRIKPSLDGTVVEELGFSGKGGYRSQDLTVATDHHHVEMTRAFYKLINPGVDWWDDAVLVVCNYYTLFTQADLETYRNMRTQIRTGWYDFNLNFFMKDKFFKHMYEKYYSNKDLYEFEEKIPESWDSLRSTFGRVSTRGQPMGVASSWPLLPLVSIFSFEKASNAQRIEISRTVNKSIQGFDNLTLTKTFMGKRQKLTLKRSVPLNYRDILVTGDDAVAKMTKLESIKHNVYLNSLGSVVSPTKDYYSPSYAIYTEIMYQHGTMLPIYPMGFILAPTSTRQCTWYSQPLAIRWVEAKYKIKINLKFSPYYYLWKNLLDQGIPIWSDPVFGGLGLSFPKHEGFRRHASRVWLLVNKNLKTILNLSPDLPELDLTKDGLITAPADTSEVPKTTERRLRAGIKVKTIDLSVRTKLIPSPVLTLPLKVWDQIYRSKNTWNQLYGQVPKEKDEPSLREYIDSFPTKEMTLTRRQVQSLEEEVQLVLQTTVDIPWGYYVAFKPTFGLLLPSTQCPVYYFNNRDLDMRTSALVFEI